MLAELLGVGRSVALSAWSALVSLLTGLSGLSTAERISHRRHLAWFCAEPAPYDPKPPFTVTVWDLSRWSFGWQKLTGRG